MRKGIGSLSLFAIGLLLLTLGGAGSSPKSYNDQGQQKRPGSPVDSSSLDDRAASSATDPVNDLKRKALIHAHEKFSGVQSADGETSDESGAPRGVPVGDDCFTAQPIVGQGTFAFDNTFATTDGPPHSLCNFFTDPQVNKDVWFCWQSPCSANVTISLCGLTSIDSKVAVYLGCACPVDDGRLLVCNDDFCSLQSEVTFGAVSGQAYLIRVGVYLDRPGGPGAMSISCASGGQPPPNDACTNAIPISIPGSQVSSTANATIDAAPACIDSINSPGVWYTVTGDGTTLTASLCNGVANYDTRLSIFTGDCSTLTCVDGNDDFCGLVSSVSWCSTPGVVYRILVHGFGGNSGPFQLDLFSDSTPCVGGGIGACCQSQGCVSGVTLSGCANSGGVYLGDGSICGAQGACCTGSQCTLNTLACCQNSGGVYFGDGTFCSPDPCGFGACCFPGDNCSMNSQAGCIISGGVYQGDFTSCSPGLCVSGATGACCLSSGGCLDGVDSFTCGLQGGDYRGDGTICGPVGACCAFGNCQIRTQDCCFAINGTFLGFSTPCSPDPCNSGACCFSGGGCTVQSQATCLSNGGSYLGNLTSCTPSPCTTQPVTQACCFTNGSCSDLISGDCVTQGGSPVGPGTSCLTTSCAPTIGACCLQDGVCVESLSPSACFEFGGTYQGDGTNCSIVSCVAPFGACCLSGGGCLDGLSVTSCGAAGGLYQGDLTTCGTVTCPAAEGACCVSGSCQLATESNCLGMGGSYQGDLSECSSFNPCAVGACCIDAGICVHLDAAGCVQYGGSYHGDLSDCEVVDCMPPVGACCLPSLSCQTLTPGDCATADGSYLGDGTDCSSAPCIPGSCCLWDGSCADANQSDCTLAGGEFTAGGTCSISTCVEGACCFELGVCYESTMTGCAAVGGSYQGAGTTCAGSFCSYGACCIPSQGCIETSASGCASSGGTYQGDFVPCAASPCLDGACCLPTGGCITASASGCLMNGGFYQGDGSICFSGLCVESTGACCLPGGDCAEATQFECDISGGNYHGDGVSCGATYCPPTCSHRGDMNQDCYPNGLDVKPFTDCELSGGPNCECADMDENGTVDEADISLFVTELLVPTIVATPNPQGVISVIEIPSPEPIPVVATKPHMISATWSEPVCGIARIQVINLGSGATLADESYPSCPDSATVTIPSALLGPTDAIKTIVTTCGPNPSHPCCQGPVSDDVTSGPIQGATYIGVADEQANSHEMRTLTCPGAAANSTWARTRNGEGDISPAGASGATYPITSVAASTPVDDVEIKRTHTDPDGDKSISVSKMTVIGIDLKIHKPKVIAPMEDEISDDDELTKGVQTFVNLDNDDQDKFFDTKGTAEDTDVPGEDEMCKIRIRIKPKDLPEPAGKVRIVEVANAAQIKLWHKANKDTEYTLNTDIAVRAGGFKEVGKWLEKELWLEGRSPSTMKQEVKLKLTYDQAATLDDQIAATIIGIDKVEWLGLNNSETNTSTLDNDPNWPGGLAPTGLRVFPDARDDGNGVVEADPRDKVEVKVTLSVDPIEDVDVFFDSFDVDDPTSDKRPVDDQAGDEASDEDNRGASPSRTGRFVKNDGTNDEDGDGVKKQKFSTKTATFRFQVTMQPGDNFRVAGNGDRDFLLQLHNPDKDYKTNNPDKQRIIDRFAKTSAAEKEVRDSDKYVSNALTVWRRMHVEQDSMAAFPAAPAAQSNYIDRIISAIAGNGMIATQITTTTDIPVSVDTTGDGVADTADNSRTLSSAPARNGRFENGSALIGPAAAPAEATNDLTGNGTRFVRCAAGFSLPAAVHKVPLIDATGGVVALAGRKFTIKFTGGALNAGHVGGNLSVCGVDMTIAAGGINVAAGEVTVDADPAITIRLHDDDDDGNGGFGLPNTVQTTYMQDSDAVANNLYAKAYIRPKFNGGGKLANNTQTVPPILNTESSDVYRWGSRANNSNRYWVVYILSAWQDSFKSLQSDKDSDTEGSTGGSTTNANSGSLIYEESIRERAATAAGGGLGLERRVVSHEVGHQMRLDHGDGMDDPPTNGLMNTSAQDGPTGADLRIIDRHLDELRRLARPR